MRILHIDSSHSIEVFKALANEHRLEMLKILSKGPKNINELSEILNIPFSTAALHIKKLEEAELIKTQIVPGRGSQKVSYNRYERVVVDLEESADAEKQIIIEREVGEFFNCEIEPTCGLLSEHGVIHMNDDPRSFYEIDSRNAQLIWFRSGHLEYHYPNRIPDKSSVKEISFSLEICSEAPYHRAEWPSDITCWINGQEIGFWVSPGDFGGKRGFLTPSWWSINNTQFGILTTWTVNHEGSFINDQKISDVTIAHLGLLDKPFISYQIGIKKESINQGGVNLFGSKFGNHAQGIIMKVLLE